MSDFVKHLAAGRIQRIGVLMNNRFFAPASLSIALFVVGCGDDSNPGFDGGPCAFGACTDASPLDASTDSAGFDTGPCVAPGSCPESVCGNGAVEAGEECDDSGTLPGDGCSVLCQLEDEPGEPTLLTPAPGSTLMGPTQVFTWSDGGEELRLYDFHVGSTLGGDEFHDTEGLGTTREVEIGGLPVDGSTIYVRLFWTDDEWTTTESNDYMVLALTQEPSGLGRDPALTTDPDRLAEASAYEQVFYDNLENFRMHLEVPFGVYTNQEAYDLDYSSASGLAIYDMLDELWSLSYMISVAEDPARRREYAALGKETLDRIIPMIVSGEGTEVCPAFTSIYYCEPGYFKYLDAAHGLGGAGFVMRAIRRDAELAVTYAADLEGWASAMVPVLDRNRRVTDFSESGAQYPHMGGKIALAFLAAGEILGNADYVQVYWDVVDMMVDNIDFRITPSGWIGSDVSHAAISMAVLHNAYLERWRSARETRITPEHLRQVGENFHTLSLSDARGYSGPMVGVYAVAVGVSPAVQAREPASYAIEGRIGSQTYSRFVEAVAGFAMGHATRLLDEM